MTKLEEDMLILMVSVKEYLDIRAAERVLEDELCEQVWRMIEEAERVGRLSHDA